MVILGRFWFFSHSNICLNKDLQLCMFWCHSWRLKMLEVTLKLRCLQITFIHPPKKNKETKSFIKLRKCLLNVYFFTVLPTDVFTICIYYLYFTRYILPFILGRFSFASNATNFFIHSLNRFFCCCFLMFLHCWFSSIE